MKTFKALAEEVLPKTIVVFFGRCNPPTTGHLLAFSVVVQTAKKLKADYSIVISRTQDKKKNPLSLSQKLEYLGILFPGIKFTGASDTMRTPIEVLKQLNKTYKNVVFIAGSDRVEEFDKLFNQYNGKEYNYDSIKVVSAGERDPDSDSASGMSATKMRTAAVDSNLATFKKGLLAHVRDIDAKRLMNDIRIGMGLEAVKESFKFETSVLREKYVAGNVFLEGSYVVEDSEVYKIINRNSNYLTVSDSSGILSKKWLTNVKPIEETIAIVEQFKGITEMKFSSSDKLKVAKIIGGMLGADVEKMTNPEQIVNAGLKLAKSKTLNAEASAILKRMLKTASDAGITYDTKLVQSDTANESTAAEMSKPTSVDSLKSDVERKHLQEVRHKTSDKGDQVIADNHHAELNKLGGKQVALPVGHSLGGSDDHHIKMKVKHYTEAKDDKYDDISDTAEFESDEAGDDDISDADIDDWISHINSEDDIIDVYDSSELSIIDSDSGDHVADVPTTDENPIHEAKGPTDNHIKKAEKHEAISALHDKAAKDIRSDMEGKGYASTVVMGGNAAKHEDAAKQHLNTAKAYRKGDGGTGQVFAKSAKLSSERAGVLKESEELNEVLSRMERIKASMRFHRGAANRERKLKIALKRHSTRPQIDHRARSLAIRTMKLKLAKKPLNQLGVADKERIERIMTRRKAVIDRMAVKLIPRIKNIEKTRLSHPTFTKQF